MARGKAEFANAKFSDSVCVRYVLSEWCASLVRNAYPFRNVVNEGTRKARIHPIDIAAQTGLCHVANALALV